MDVAGFTFLYERYPDCGNVAAVDGGGCCSPRCYLTGTRTVQKYNNYIIYSKKTSPLVPLQKGECVDFTSPLPPSEGEMYDSSLEGGARQTKGGG